MAQCVAFDANGVLMSSTADPCTTMVVLTPAEYGAMSLAPFQLSLADGAQIGLAILSVWAVGWSFRMLIRAVDVDRGSAVARDEG